MKRERFAAATIAALLTVTACAENPVGPAASSGYRANAVSSAREGGSPYTFKKLDVAGAAQTIPSGINAGGRVVGWYVQGGVTRGFVYDDGVFTTNIVYPGAAFTQLRGVGPGGEITGVYRNAGETGPAFHGFVLTTDGAFIEARFPGHANNITQRIMPDGTLLGCYHDGDTMGSMHGATISREAYIPNSSTVSGEGYSSIDNFASMTNGGTPGGRTFTGQFVDMNTNLGRAFVIDGGEFTPFDAPGSDFTVAWDMNPAGTIVGQFEAAGTSHIHGFVLDQWRVAGGVLSGSFTTIDFPLSPSVIAAYTDVFGINPRGDIVGKYRETASGPFHGYIATRKTE
jgi:probable HAF family extracellular repeat protein